MAIENAIAQFGLQAGRDIQNTVGNAIARAENRSRYEDQKNMLLADREREAALHQEEAQKDFGRQWVDAYYKAPPEARQNVAIGGYQESVRRGYIDPNEMPEPPDDAMMQRLAGKFGSDFGMAKRGTPSEIQEFNYLTDIVQNPDKYPTEVVKAAQVKLGTKPRAVGSSAITIADEGKTDVVAQSESTIEGAKAGAKEEGKLNVQAKLLPGIRASIKQAEKEATAKGETVTDLTRAKAALPGLEETVAKLKQLAPIATNTLTGRAFNTVVRELGFGATEGATARAQFISIVDNQVLPLLRDTFGAAFTQKEGETLKATMGDPNLSTEEKIAQLDAFIQQKYRDIETKERELGLSEPASIDDLVAKYAQ